MADYVKMWTPDEGQTFIDGDYTYTVQANSTLSVKVTSTDKVTYGQIKDNLIINGETYTTTSMDGCFEGCSNLTTAPIIPAGITSMQSCFKGCTKLSGNIVALNSTINSYTDIFTNTDAARKIFIVHSTEVPDTSADIAKWQTIAEDFSNVYYKAENNPNPTNISTVERGAYDENEGKWKPDDTEDDIKVVITAGLSTQYLPEYWTNEIKSYSVIFEDVPVTLVDAQINGATVTGYILNEENAGTIRTTVTDSYNNTSNEATAEVYNIFVMLDFYPGGEGMAIGKASERNGLDIAIPTTIGEGLDPPTIFEPTEDTTVNSEKTYYSDKDRIVEAIPQEGDNPQAKGWYEDTKVIDLSNYQFIVGKYNKKRNDSMFIVGGGKEEEGVETRSNLMEIGNDLITIGDSDEGHVEIDYHSMQLKDKEGDAYFYVSDLREKNDNYQATITETFIGDGTITSFTVQLPVSAEVSATDSSHSSNAATRSRQVYTFTTAPNNGATITIIYKTTSQSAKAYTFGTRATGTVGAMSVAEGFRTTASGTYSHAEGMGTTASGYVSHAEGIGTEASGMGSHAEGISTTASGSRSHAEGAGTTASGNASHAEGFGTTASGLVSHAEGRETTATRASQTALGQYNIADTGGIDETTRGDYIVIVGNGTSSQRSNALTVDWNGNLNIAGTLTTINKEQRTGVSYIRGCAGDNTLLYQPHTYNESRFTPAITIQTYGGGGWAIGNYNSEDLEFVYGSKTNIDNNTNTVQHIRFTSTGYVNANSGYNVNGSPLFAYKSVVSKATTVAANATQRVTATFTLTAPYRKVIGVRQITTNHNNATIISGFGVDGDGAVGNTVTVFADCRNLNSSAITDETVTFEVYLGV